MGEKGQSLVELAVSLVFVLLLLAGAVELGTALFQYIQLRDAVQEGALYGSVCQNHNEISLRVRAASNKPIDLEESVKDGSLVICVDEEVGGKVDYDCVLDLSENPEGIYVSATYEHKMFMPLLAGRTINLKAQVTDTILENQCP